jgi:hypothetical protein
MRRTGDFPSPKALANDSTAFGIHTVNLKPMRREIETNGGDFHGRGLL